MGKQELIKVGFWTEGEGSPYPHPSDHVEEKWSAKHAEHYLELLDKIEADEGTHKLFYKGVSLCRICHQSNGSVEYRRNGYVWPSGYRHYVAEHSVRMPTPFRSMLKQFVEE